MYKTILIILFITVVYNSNSVFSQDQEKKIKFIGIESGVDIQACEDPEYDFIRNGTSIYGIGDGTDNLSYFYAKWYVGAKEEIRSKNNKFGLSMGLRFSKIISSLGKSSTWSSPSDFFYLLYNQEETVKEFLKVKEINQSSYYLGIPIEIKYFPCNPRFFRFFIKGSLDVSYRLKTKTDVVFYNNTMENYQSDVVKKFNDPKKLVLMFYASIGFKLGHDNKPCISLEAALPSFYITKTSSSLVNPVAGGGLQINIQIPLK